MEGKSERQTERENVREKRSTREREIEMCERKR